MKHLKLQAGMALVACLGVSMSANAQLTCSDLTFNEDMMAGAAAACQEVVERNGSTYAKLTAEVVDQRPSGTVYRWILPEGGMGERQEVARDFEDFLAMVGGEPVKIRDLPERQRVNVYLPSTFWSLPAAEPVAMAAEPEPEPMAEPEPMPEPEPAPVMLPKTGSQLNWLAVLGSMFVLLGGALRFTRS